MVVSISAQQAARLSDVFAEASRAVVGYMHENFNKFSMRQYEILSDMQFRLRDAADDLITDAVAIVLDEGQGDVAKLEDATKTASTALKSIKNIKNAIDVVTSLLALAVAIPTGDFEAIYGAFEKVKENAQEVEAEVGGSKKVKKQASTSARL